MTTAVWINWNFLFFSLCSGHHRDTALLPCWQTAGNVATPAFFSPPIFSDKAGPCFLGLLSVAGSKVAWAVGESVCMEGCDLKSHSAFHGTVFFHACTIIIILTQRPFGWPPIPSPKYCKDFLVRKFEQYFNHIFKCWLLSAWMAQFNAYWYY